jgi:hypothetical protein
MPRIGSALATLSLLIAGFAAIASIVILAELRSQPRTGTSSDIFSAIIFTLFALVWWGWPYLCVAGGAHHFRSYPLTSLLYLVGAGCLCWLSLEALQGVVAAEFTHQLRLSQGAKSCAPPVGLWLIGLLPFGQGIVLGGMLLLTSIAAYVENRSYANRTLAMLNEVPDEPFVTTLPASDAIKAQGELHVQRSRL